MLDALHVMDLISKNSQMCGRLYSFSRRGTTIVLSATEMLCHLETTHEWHKNKYCCFVFFKTIIPMTLYSRTEGHLSDLHIQRSRDSVIQKRNVPSHFSANRISVHCEFTRLPYACQMLSHWHLMKNIIYLLLHLQKTAFPNNFVGTKIRSNFRCYSDCQVSQSQTQAQTPVHNRPCGHTEWDQICWYTLLHVEQADQFKVIHNAYIYRVVGW